MKSEEFATAKIKKRCLTLQKIRYSAIGRYFLLNVEFRRVHPASAEGIFDGFVGRVDIQFTEYVFAVGGNGMNAGETLLCNFLSRFALGNGFDNFHFRGC